MAHVSLVGVSEIKSPDNKIWKFPYAFPIIISQLRLTSHTFDVIDTHLHKLTPEELVACLIESDSQVFGISAYFSE